MRERRRVDLSREETDGRVGRMNEIVKNVND